MIGFTTCFCLISSPENKKIKKTPDEIQVEWMCRMCWFWCPLLGISSDEEIQGIHQQLAGILNELDFGKVYVWFLKQGYPQIICNIVASGERYL